MTIQNVKQSISEPHPATLTVSQATPNNTNSIHFTVSQLMTLIRLHHLMTIYSQCAIHTQATTQTLFIHTHVTAIIKEERNAVSKHCWLDRMRSQRQGHVERGHVIGWVSGSI